MKRFFMGLLAAILLLPIFDSCQKDKPIQVLNSVSIDSLVIDTVCPLFHNYDQPSCQMHLSLERPVSTTPKGLLSLVEVLISGFLSDTDQENPTRCLEPAVNNCVHDYLLSYMSDGQESIMNFGDEVRGASWMNYEKCITGRVTYNAKGFFCYRYTDYSYSGGAHGITTTRTAVVDLQKQQALTLSSVFSEAVLDSLSLLMQQQIMLDLDARPADERTHLREQYSINEVCPTDNFLFSDQGMIWIFDPTILAPYSVGTIEVSLPWEQLSSLLLSDSSLHRLCSPS